MNFLYFVSLMLMFSLTVRAIPQKMCNVNDPSCYLGMNIKSFGAKELAKNDDVQENPQDTQKLINLTMDIDFETPVNSDLLTMLMDKMKPLLDTRGGCSYKLDRILCAKRQIVAGVNTKMVMKICPDQCSPLAETVNQGCRICKVKVFVSLDRNILRIDKLDCFGEDVDLCGEPQPR